MNQQEWETIERRLFFTPYADTLRTLIADTAWYVLPQERSLFLPHPHDVNSWVTIRPESQGKSEHWKWFHSSLTGTQKSLVGFPTMKKQRKMF